MDYDRFQRDQRIREHVKYMVNFVNTYCEHIQAKKPVFNFVESFYFLPDLLKYVVVGIVNKTLNDSSLLELSSRVLHFQDRGDRLLHSFMLAYKDEFTDYGFIQWATMFCTLSSVLKRQGFELALETALETIDTLCTDRNRYKSFVLLGCHI